MPLTLEPDGGNKKASVPVKIEGKDLPAGAYGFFIALGGRSFANGSRSGCSLLCTSAPASQWTRYASKGDFKKALTYLKFAATVAPDEGAKRNTDALIRQVEEGKNINQ